MGVLEFEKTSETKLEEMCKCVKEKLQRYIYCDMDKEEEWYEYLLKSMALTIAEQRWKTLTETNNIIERLGMRYDMSIYHKVWDFSEGFENERDGLPDNVGTDEQIRQIQNAYDEVGCYFEFCIEWLSNYINESIPENKKGKKNVDKSKGKKIFYELIQAFMRIEDIKEETHLKFYEELIKQFDKGNNSHSILYFDTGECRVYNEYDKLWKKMFSDLEREVCEGDVAFLFLVFIVMRLSSFVNSEYSGCSLKKTIDKIYLYHEILTLYRELEELGFWKWDLWETLLNYFYEWHVADMCKIEGVTREVSTWCASTDNVICWKDSDTDDISFEIVDIKGKKNKKYEEYEKVVDCLYRDNNGLSVIYFIKLWSIVYNKSPRDSEEFYEKKHNIIILNRGWYEHVNNESQMTDYFKVLNIILKTKFEHEYWKVKDDKDDVNIYEIKLIEREALSEKERIKTLKNIYLSKIEQLIEWVIEWYDKDVNI